MSTNPIYAAISNYISDYHYKLQDYKRTREYNETEDKEYVRSVIARYGDLPVTELTCQYLSRVREGFYKNIFHIESESSSLGLAELYKQMFYDSGVMIHLQCALNRLFGDESLAAISPLWKKDVHRIGDTSADGMVYTGEIGGYDKFVIFKVAKSGTEDEIKYENLIGHLINKVRLDGCLNFAYTYGIAECSKSDNYCETDQLVIMQEFIDGQSASSYIKEADPSGFMDMVCQLTLSLNQAQNRIGFRHLDLHSNNMMRRRYGSGSTGEFLLPYDNGLFVKTKGIATIIDYGRSCASINNELIVSGHTFDRDGGVLSRVADIFKFLNFLYYEYRTDSNPNRYNKEVINMLIAMLQFFIGERVDITTYSIEQLRDTYYVLPYTSRDLNYDDFHNYLKTHPSLRGWYNQVVVTDPGTMLVLGCMNACSNPSKYADYTQLSTVASPLDFMLRANEGWEVNLDQTAYDKITDDIINFVQANRAAIPGIVELAKGAVGRINGENNKNRLMQL